jgi:crotonobetainyl-CoA:carnitine CoA-transferase CaiB-like acyl-CoA transferase
VELLNDRRFAVSSFDVAAANVGWLLRTYGAAVEHETALDPEGIGAFLGPGARAVRVPTLAPPGWGAFITDAPVTAANRATIERVAETRPVVWITPWGLGTDWDERPWSNLLVMAAGGWMSAVGEPDRQPLGPPGSQAQFAAGLFAAIHALAGGDAPGLSCVSMVESVAATCIYDVVAFQYYGNLRGRVGPRFAASQCTLVTLPAKDGWLGIHAALHHQFVSLCRVIGRPELATDPRFAAIPDRAAHLPELDAYISEWSSSTNRWDAYHALQKARIPCAPAPSITEVLASPQLEARGAWASVTTPAGRAYRVPGAPSRVQATPPPAAVEREPELGPWRPGALRVVDFAMGWAGPLVSYVLACYDADVIKLESHTRFDWWRGSRPPGDDPALRLWERSHAFNTANRGKRGLTLDLTTPEGNAIGRRLLLSADVVIENYTAGVVERLGLDYGSLAKDNPRLIMLRQPGYGATGPEHAYRVFGNTIEGMSGLTSQIGYEPEGYPYQMSNAFGDPISGLNGAFAVLAALKQRERTGRGCCIEAAQLEGFLPLTSEAMIQAQRDGRPAPRNGNRRPGRVPSGLFPTAEPDRWVAIEVRDDREWLRLAALIGGPAADSSLASISARIAREAEVEAVIATWTSQHPRDDLVSALVAAGVPAAPLHNEADLLQADPFATRDFFEGMDREVVGFHMYPSLPVSQAGARPRASSAAPTLGQHTAEVLAGFGYDAAAVERLRAALVTGTQPG